MPNTHLRRRSKARGSAVIKDERNARVLLQHVHSPRQREHQFRSALSADRHRHAPWCEAALEAQQRNALTQPTRHTHTRVVKGERSGKGAGSHKVQRKKSVRQGGEILLKEKSDKARERGVLRAKRWPHGGQACSSSSSPSHCLEMSVEWKRFV